MGTSRSGALSLATTLLAGLLILALPGCTTTPPQPDPRYRFPELEQVNRISSLHYLGWDVIDKRSLIVTASPKKRYLLILDRNVPELKYAHVIGFTSTGSSIYAKFDCVKVVRPRSCAPGLEARIRTIYKLASKDDIPRIKAQIRAR